MGSGALSAGPPPPPTPHKKMKKRKELNALIGLAGDGGRKKPKKSSGHRLLRTEPPASDSDSDSGEEEEDDSFGALGDRHFRCRRGGLLQCCKVCYPFCGFLVLTACTVTCIGLVWMQVALKESMDTLREQLKAMESSQRNSFQELPRINDDLLMKQKHLDDIVSGHRGLNTLWTNITEMNKQIAMLSGAVNQLKASLKSASDLINLPKSMEDLQKSVASLGSTLTSVHHDVETMQTAADEQKKKVETLQKDVVEGALGSLNATLLEYLRQNDLRLHDMSSTVSNISQRVSVLESNPSLGYRTDSNASLSVGDLSVDLAAESSGNSSRRQSPEKSSKTGQSPAADLQEQLQLIHALTSNPETAVENVGAAGRDAVTSRPFLAKVFPRSLRRKRSRRGLLLRRVITEEDLREAFRQSPQGQDGKLSMEELEELLGAQLPLPRSLRDYDVDGDNLFCLTEVTAALAGQ